MKVKAHRRTPWTVALRWCSSCDKFLGIKVWPRETHLFVHTHGLCKACFEQATLKLPEQRNDGAADDRDSTAPAAHREASTATL
jgi:hypothetical protein